MMPKINEFQFNFVLLYIQVYSSKAFHKWINTPCLTDFKMEMSTGVFLLRTAQSLLTGRTIHVDEHVMVLQW